MDDRFFDELFVLSFIVSQLKDIIPEFILGLVGFHGIDQG
jgi:hypothetical protein